MPRGGKRPGAGRKRTSLYGAPTGTAAFVVTESGTDRPCKVGFVLDLQNKLSAWGAGNHRLLVLRHSEVLGAESRSSCEATIIARLAKHRLKGNWFDVEVDEAVAVVKKAAREGRARERTRTGNTERMASSRYPASVD